jgi:hypothetical protein
MDVRSVPPAAVKLAKAMCKIHFSSALFLVFAFSTPSFAHHGNAAYDLDHPITLKGTITEFLWANPHVQVYFDANEKGKTEQWSCETVSPGILIRQGWKKDELKSGQRITITIAPAKSGATVGYVLEIVTEDGRDYKLGQGRDRAYP